MSPVVVPVLSGPRTAVSAVNLVKVNKYFPPHIKGRRVVRSFQFTAAAVRREGHAAKIIAASSKVDGA